MSTTNPRPKKPSEMNQTERSVWYSRLKHTGSCLVDLSRENPGMSINDLDAIITPIERQVWFIAKVEAALSREERGGR